MKLRLGNINALVGRRRDSSEMMPLPKPDADVLAHLRRTHGNCLVNIEADIKDRARLEHSHWCTSGDWHVASHIYYVDDDDGKVYIVVKMEGN